MNEWKCVSRKVLDVRIFGDTNFLNGLPKQANFHTYCVISILHIALVHALCSSFYHLDMIKRAAFVLAHKHLEDRLLSCEIVIDFARWIAYQAVDFIFIHISPRETLGALIKSSRFAEASVDFCFLSLAFSSMFHPRILSHCLHSFSARTPAHKASKDNAALLNLPPLESAERGQIHGSTQADKHAVRYETDSMKGLRYFAKFYSTFETDNENIEKNYCKC